MSFKKDLEFGLNKEKEILVLINKYFKREIHKTIDKYCKYDFFDFKYNYELKSRRCSINTYDTTLLPFDKIQRKTIYLFNFTDGLYYIKYKKEIFDEFEKKEYVRNKREGKNDIKKEYIYIPTNKLIKIEISEDKEKKEVIKKDNFIINFN
jgi:hypothetical protein